MWKKPSQQEVHALIDQMCEDMREQVDEEHDQKKYKIKGWFRTKFKVNPKTTLASAGVGGAKIAYKGGKQAVGVGLDLTLKNIPGVAFVTGLITLLTKAVEYGVVVSERKLTDKVVKKLADKGIKGSRSKAVKMATHKYTADQGIAKIKSCLDKLQYASGLMDKHVATCGDFIERLHDFEWFEYRMVRLFEEIAYLESYASMLEEDADKFMKAREPYRERILSRAERLLIEIPDDRHEKCGEFCLLTAVRAKYPWLYRPDKAVPQPPSRRPQKPVPPRRFPGH